MDRESNRVLKECVLRILTHGDPNKLTESKVRKLAADETGFDLTDPANRKLVKLTVENYFVNKQADGSHPEKAAQTKAHKPPAKQSSQNPVRRRTLILDGDEDEEEEPRAHETKSNGSSVESEQQDTSVESQEEGERKPVSRKTKKRRAGDTEDEEAVTEQRGNGKKRPVLSESMNFPNGDDPICQLSKNRFVIVQDFNGKTLVSIREYYEKDGQQLPTKKGISLTVEQWEVLKEGIPDIEAAIKESRR